MKNMQWSMAPERLSDRHSLLRSFDRPRTEMNDLGKLAGVAQFISRASEMSSSSKVRDVRHSSREPQEVRAKSGSQDSV